MVNEFRRIEDTDGICIVVKQTNPQTGQVIERPQVFMRSDLEKQLASSQAGVIKWQDALAFLDAPVVE